MVGGSLGTPAASTTKTGRHDIAESGVKPQKAINQSTKGNGQSECKIFLTQTSVF
jgi:hypothetical protein